MTAKTEQEFRDEVESLLRRIAVVLERLLVAVGGKVGA